MARGVPAHRAGSRSSGPLGPAAASPSSLQPARSIATSSTGRRRAQAARSRTRLRRIGVRSTRMTAGRPARPRAGAPHARSTRSDAARSSPSAAATAAWSSCRCSMSNAIRRSRTKPSSATATSRRSTVFSAPSSAWHPFTAPWSTGAWHRPEAYDPASFLRSCQPEPLGDHLTPGLETLQPGIAVGPLRAARSPSCWLVRDALRLQAAGRPRAVPRRGRRAPVPESIGCSCSCG